MNNEVAPYILTKGSENAKNNIYLQTFDISLIANIRGEKPIYQFGFLESQESYMKRLNAWDEFEKKLIFDGWSCQDMGLFQILTREYDETKIEITPFSGYSVTTETGKKIDFYLLPDTIDDFITDMRRIGIKLFWKDRVVNEYGDEVTSDKKVVEYYRIIKNMIKD
jgi:hypothetical protein